MKVELNKKEISIIKANLGYLMKEHRGALLKQEIETIKTFIEKLENAEIEEIKESMRS